MTERSRVKFNPVTKEIEVEGSESFVKTYFGKLQAMISGAAEKKGPVKRAPKAVKAKKATKKKPGVKRVTNIDVIVGLIQGAPEGISTAELKEKTGFAETKIWNIIASAKKMGKIKQAKRGVYKGIIEIH